MFCKNKTLIEASNLCKQLLFHSNVSIENIKKIPYSTRKKSEGLLTRENVIITRF
jgi:hypothetical protein